MKHDDIIALKGEIATDLLRDMGLMQVINTDLGLLEEEPWLESAKTRTPSYKIT